MNVECKKHGAFWSQADKPVCPRCEKSQSMKPNSNNAIVARVYEAVEFQGTMQTNMTDLQRALMKRAVVEAIWPNHAAHCRVYAHPSQLDNECNCTKLGT